MTQPTVKPEILCILRRRRNSVVHPLQTSARYGNAENKDPKLFGNCQYVRLTRPMQKLAPVNGGFFPPRP
jgi:hypothetical protein